MPAPLIRKVDCVSLPVASLDDALAFYRDRLGHRLIWRTVSACGLRLADSETELVLHTDRRPPAAELLVESVGEAVVRFQRAGGTLVTGPFDIQIGRCAVVSDPWGNQLVLLDISKGPLKPDVEDDVAGLLPKREGHFVFESGHHGVVWVDLETLFVRPERVQPLADALADRLRGYQAAVVCSPLVEGAFLGLMVASSLRVPFSYSQPVRGDRATSLFPVSYPIPRSLERTLQGQRVAIVNDVINAGSAVRGTLASLKACGAQPVAIGALAVYGDAARTLAASQGVALETLASFPSRIWKPDACPLCATGVPLDA
jgi:orotate phosphoribosyltransferase